MSKEFSELNGYGVKDAVAREEIEQLKNSGGSGGKLYLHYLIINWGHTVIGDDDQYSIRIQFMHSSKEPIFPNPTSTKNYREFWEAFDRFSSITSSNYYVFLGGYGHTHTGSDGVAEDRTVTGTLCIGVQYVSDSSAMFDLQVCGFDYGELEGYTAVEYLSHEFEDELTVVETVIEM